MRNRLVWLGGALVVFMAIAGSAIAKTDKVTICHAAGLAGTDKYVRIVVSSNAIFGHFENPGTPRAGHEEDILLQGEQQCPTDNVTTPTPTPSLSPTPTPETSPTSTPSESPSPSMRVSDTPTPSESPSDLPNTAMSGIMR